MHGVPVLLMSGVLRRSYIEEIEGSEYVDAFLEKPVSSALLSTVVRQLLTQSLERARASAA